MTEEFSPSEWITTREAAELTGYDYAHVRRLAREGRIEARRLGRDWLLLRVSVEEYVEKMKKLGAAKQAPCRTGARESGPKDKR